MVAFNDAVQWRTVNCREQSCASGSDDWEYCALNSLAAAENWGGNRYVRLTLGLTTSRWQQHRM